MYIMRRVQGYFMFDCMSSSSLDTTLEVFFSVYEAISGKTY